jgi:hypothetical protein
MTFVDAKTWNCRPSDLLAITDDYVAFCLDQAVGYFGRVVEADLEAVEGKTDAERNQKRDRVLQKYIGDKDEKPRRGQFADPAAMFS